MKHLINTLPVNSIFNVVSFGSRHDSIFPQSVPKTNENVENALKQIETFEANYGGTEILKPIKDINSK